MLPFPLQRLMSNCYFSGAGIFLTQGRDFQLISLLAVEGLLLKPSCGWSTGALSSLQAQALGLIQKVLLNRFLYSFFFERACLSKTILSILFYSRGNIFILKGASLP